MGKKRDAWERFLEKVEIQPTGCWLWTAAKNPKGYGHFHPMRDRPCLAHRWAYEQWYGPVPPGLVLDHFACDTPSCVNPDHVRPVTSRENTLRSTKTLAAQWAARKTCPEGHEWNRLPGSGRRVCNVCRREKVNRQRAEARAERASGF